MTEASHRFSIPAGILDLKVRHSEFPLEDLLTVAQRENPKRAFLFVSKVLGRHIPVRPSIHRAILRELAIGVEEHLPASGPVLFMGYAETAVGLGAGVHDEVFAGTGRPDMMYLPSTRHPEVGNVWFSFSEDHSHATAHHVLRPTDAILADRALSAETLVLVDDEVTTGKTFLNLISAASAAGLAPRTIILVTLTDWSDGLAAKTITEELGIDPDCLRIVSLVRGAWSFQADQTAPLRAIPKAESRLAPGPILEGGWRAGFAGHTEMSTPNVPGNRRVLVIGTGEHVWAPFRLAEEIERIGHDVGFLATTRSPVSRGDVIVQKAVFCDHYGLGIPMYLHNVDPAAWDVIFLWVETADVSAIDPDLAAYLGDFIAITATGTSVRFINGAVA